MNRRASGPILQSGFLAVPDHSVIHSEVCFVFLRLSKLLQLSTKPTTQEKPLVIDAQEGKKSNSIPDFRWNYALRRATCECFFFFCVCVGGPDVSALEERRNVKP